MNAIFVPNDQTSLQNQHYGLMSSHAANKESQRLPVVGTSDCLATNAPGFQPRTNENCLVLCEAGSLIESDSTACLLTSLESEGDTSAGDAPATIPARGQDSSDLWSTVAFVRHGERADGPEIWNDPWTGSADARAYPYDPPLTHSGVLQAKRIASDLSQCGAFDIVVSSPFLRCVQTAIVLADFLGARLLIDNGIGEIFTPSIFGEHDTLDNPLRTLKGLASAVDGGVKAYLKHTRAEPCMHWDRVVGSPPVWPEDDESARRRLTLRCLTYLKRARKMKQSYILVGHQALLEQALHVLPATMTAQVNDVPFCGALVAMWSRKKMEESPPYKGTRRRSQSDCTNGSVGNVIHSMESPQKISAAELRMQMNNWEVAIQGVKLDETRRPRKASIDELQSPLADLQRLLDPEEEPNMLHKSIRELVRAIEKRNCRTALDYSTSLDVSESEVGSPSPMTISPAPDTTRSTRTPMSSCKSKSPFKARRADQASKVALISKRAQTCEMGLISHSTLLARRKSIGSYSSN